MIENNEVNAENEVNEEPIKFRKINKLGYFEDYARRSKPENQKNMENTKKTEVTESENIAEEIGPDGIMIFNKLNFMGIEKTEDADND